MTIPRTPLVAAALLAALRLPAAALQEGNAAAAAPCSRPEHRHFDFWIGTWEVRTPDGEVAGTNRIEPILGGCALRESWTSAQGSHGTSLNAYDPARGVWHQTWVAERGPILYLDGGLENGQMVMSAETPSQDDPSQTVRHRITWAPLESGGVRQHWEASTDDGATWQTVFDGTYVPLDAP